MCAEDPFKRESYIERWSSRQLQERMRTPDLLLKDQRKLAALSRNAGVCPSRMYAALKRNQGHA